ncbi:uncharacterized protein EV154DRAFT_420683, partial [Mucor mucedo]|uniref:uncharacterized protein n=1 Tax=Mucor mucedo TaxID=29922 RepID=UPI00221E69F9
LENSKATLYESKPKGIPVIDELFEQVSDEAEDLKALTDIVSESLIPIVERLKQIKGQLGRLALTHKWTLKETDLRAYHLQLEEIENLKQDGIFKDPASDTIPEGQALINFLLRSCHRIMDRMSSESVPVSEALMPVYNQLSTVKRCLLEVSKWGKPDSSKTETYFLWIVP